MKFGRRVKLQLCPFKLSKACNKFFKKFSIECCALTFSFDNRLFM